MKPASFENWTGKARAVKIEDELARRGIKLRDSSDQCGVATDAGKPDSFIKLVERKISLEGDWVWKETGPVEPMI